jgi:hypothetical protein
MKDIVTPIISFFQDFPYFEEIGFNVGELRFVNSISEANALEYRGTPQPTPRYDILGNVYLEKQANFVLLLSRMKDDDIKSTTISNLLFNLEEWVEEQNFLGLCPKLGDDPETERMWADNGRWYSGTEDEAIDIYQVQIHIKYLKKYETVVSA